MNPTRTLYAKYVSYLIAIVGGWFITTVRAAPSFDVLVSTSALITLSVLLVTWMVGCSAHYSATGSFDPVPPVTLRRDGAGRLPPPPPPSTRA